MGSIITIHSFLSLSWDEWLSIAGILGALIAIIRWTLKKTKNDLLKPLLEQISRLTRTIQDVTAWQLKADDRLEDGDKKFVKHDEQLKDHERRIGKLEEMRGYGRKNYW